MFRKLALLLSILAVSKVAFANTGSQGSAVVVEESHKKFMKSTTRRRRSWQRAGKRS